MASIGNPMQSAHQIHPSLHSIEDDRSTHQSFKQGLISYKPVMKATVLGAMALLGIAGIYCARKFFAGNSAIQADPLLQTAHPELNLAHRIVSVRALPTPLPLEDQVAIPGSVFEVSREFFKDAGGGYIQQKMTKGPVWLTSQLNPIVTRFGVAFLYANMGVQVVGNTAYVAASKGLSIFSSSGLVIINVTSPSSPALLGTYYSGQNAFGVQVVGNIAYLACANGLQIVNITKPNHMALIGTYVTNGSTYEVQTLRNIAYVVGDSGLTIINVTTPSRSTFIGSYNTSGIAGNIQIVGTTAYLACENGLQIVNIAKPSAPTLIGTYHDLIPDLPALSVQVIGKAVFMSCSTNGLKVINITKPANPILIGTYPGSARGVQVVGNIAYTISSGQLKMLNIATPSRPTLVGSYNTTLVPTELQVVGATVYVADAQSGLQIINGLNQFKLSGTPSILDRSNYLVTIEGTSPLVLPLLHLP